MKAGLANSQLVPEQMTSIVLRPLASSLPLGFFAFGMGTILLTAVELRWAATALTLIGTPPGARTMALAVFLLMMAAIMLMLSAASFRAKPAFSMLLLVGACRFALTGVYQGALGGGMVVARVAGWIGLPLAVFSLYAGLALMLEDSAQRTVLPIGRRGRARSSLEGTIAQQIEAAEREAGVRRQL